MTWGPPVHMDSELKMEKCRMTQERLVNHIGKTDVIVMMLKFRHASITIMIVKRGCIFTTTLIFNVQ